MSTINLGTLAVDRTIPPPSLGGRITNSNRNDVYQFELQEAMSFNLDLSQIASGSNLNVALGLDRNQNNRIDAGEEVVRSSNSGNQNEVINVRSLEAGHYLININRSSGSDSNYLLRLSTTGRGNGSVGISNLLAQQEDFGTLRNTNVNRRDYHVDDKDTADVFKFTLDNTSNVRVLLTGLTEDADVRLIRDRNNNRIIDATEFNGQPNGEILGVGYAGGTSDDQISMRLGRGTYFVQVFQFAEGRIDYDLSVQVRPA
ncbi:MAG: pre-peptidase C-terminal domain-containing protein [Oculatellaceae cyanobacterium bins.114]|nr:pre-peptidase C-terminal domain-containing protein [Oculatellaceae cyanobacterium bins.114]